jgi:hypothetical protein
MPARSRRLLPRIALAGLLVAFCLPATAVGADAAAPVSLSVKVGYQGSYKAQEWMPVAIDVKNAGPDMEASIQLESVFTSQPGVPSPALYELPLSLPAGASKHLRTYAMVNPAAGLTLTVRVLLNGRVLASQSTTGGTNAGTLIGVFSDDPAALDEFAALHPGGVSARVAHLQAQDLADSAIVLRAFDLIAIDDFSTDILTSGQKAALKDFVAAGGSLLLGTGASWRKTLAGIPAELQPLAPTGTTIIARSSALGGAARIEVATGVTNAATAWLAEGSHPLLIESRFGSGLITMASFDWNQPAVSASAETKSLLRQVIVRNLTTSAGQQNVPMGIGGGGFTSAFGGSGTSITERSNALSGVLGNLPALDLPSLQLTGALVLFYVLLVGPINYVVLGRMRRRELSWITVPLIAVIVAGGAYGIGIGTKGRSVQSNQVAIVHGVLGAEHAYQETYTGIMAPTRGDYQVTVAGENLMISPISGNGVFSSSPSPTQIGPLSNTVTLRGITAFSLRGFATESMSVAPQLVGHLQLVNGQLTGRVENHSTIAFDDAVLMAGDNFQKLGSLKPGAGVAIQLAAKPGNLFGGQPLYTRIYSNSTFGPGPSNPTPEDREGQARTQVLSLLQPGLGYKGIASTSIQPIVVAWTKRSLQGITVNGAEPRGTAQSAIAFSLPIERVGAGPLPAGAVTGRIIDVTGDTQPAGPPGVFTLQNGSVTYEFTPSLASGAHLGAASLNSSNPYGPKVIPPVANGGPPITTEAEVWDWQHRSWTGIAYQDNGTTAIPDGAIESASGSVRLRISGSNASFMSGGVSLTGTIR